jgi:hypothetical protein
MTDWSLPQLLAGLHDDSERVWRPHERRLATPAQKGDASESVWLQLFQTYLRTVGVTAEHASGGNAAKVQSTVRIAACERVGRCDRISI